MTTDDAECIARWLSAAESGHLDAGAECIVAEVRRLRAEIEMLRKALKPFADAKVPSSVTTDWHISFPDDVPIGYYGTTFKTVTCGACRRAAEALAATEPPKAVPGGG